MDVRPVIVLQLNQQQLELLDRTIAKGAAPDRGRADPPGACANIAASARRQGPSHERRSLSSPWLLEPGTGKAIELLAGQILRIEQVEGGQCVDFNCLQPARLQGVHALRPHPHRARLQPDRGHLPLVARRRASGRCSTSSRTRSGATTCCFRAARAYLYESAYGFDVHTNCHDIQAEAQREYGLTPDDVHDSFNFFMNTEVTRDGRATITRQEPSPATMSTCSPWSMCWRSPMSAAPTSCGPRTSR